jgi:hypothetical protein
MIISDLPELVGQDGILRPIVNRPSCNEVRLMRGPIANRPQDSILPPKCSSSPPEEVRVSRWSP